MLFGMFNNRRRSSILALGVLAAAVCPALGQTTIVSPAGAFESFAYGAGGSVGVGIVRLPQGNPGAYLFRVGQPGVSLNPIAATGQAVSGSFAYGAGGNQQVGFTIVDLDVNDGQPATDQATLWTGTAASAVYLNPPGIERGIALSTDGVNQSGAVSPNGVSLAAVWSGTAASYVSIHPTTGFDDSTAYGVHRGKAVGTGTDTDQQFFAAIYWPTLDAASAIMLRQPTELESQANAIFSPLTGPTLVFGAAYPDG
ncbi:MAG: hypothetical protein K2Q20_13980, partial [Phycisphaerales bacterium]|nr:hypothetical protein [Phycisphaerales bacterium]